jgi:hypothetical protein
VVFGQPRESENAVDPPSRAAVTKESLYLECMESRCAGDLASDTIVDERVV